MSGESGSLLVPSFYTKATMHYAGYGGATYTRNIPWLETFPFYNNDLCVVTEDNGATPAGLYVMGPPAQVIPGTSNLVAPVWRLLLSFTDMCAMVANGSSIDIYLNNTSAQSLPAGTVTYRNGQLQGSSALVNDPTSVWLVATPISGGGAATGTAVPLAAAAAGLAGTAVAASHEDHVHPITPAAYAGGIPQVLSAPTWNATTNLVSGVTLVDGVIPTIGGVQYYAFQVGVAGSTTLGGISTWNVGDIIEIAIIGGTPTWTRNSGNPVTANLTKGDNTGGLLAATPGWDYAVAPISCAVDIVFPSAWTMASGGALTINTGGGGTAFAVTHAKCWMYFAAGALNTGSVAGFYYTQMASTTTGQVFQDRYIPGNNKTTDANSWHFPASPTAWGATTPGTYAFDSSYRAFLSTQIPQGYMGRNGWIVADVGMRCSPTAGSRTLHFTLGGTSNVMFSAAIAGTTNIWAYVGGRTQNRDDQAVQVSTSILGSPFFTGNTSPGISAIDTNAVGGKTASIELNCSTTADWVVMTMALLTVSPGTI